MTLSCLDPCISLLTIIKHSNTKIAAHVSQYCYLTCKYLFCPVLLVSTFLHLSALLFLPWKVAPYCASQITILHLNGPDQLTTPEVTEVQKVNPEVIAHADAMESNSNHQF